MSMTIFQGVLLTRLQPPSRTDSVSHTPGVKEPWNDRRPKIQWSAVLTKIFRRERGVSPSGQQCCCVCVRSGSSCMTRFSCHFGLIRVHIRHPNCSSIDTITTFDSSCIFSIPSRFPFTLPLHFAHPLFAFTAASILLTTL